MRTGGYDYVTMAQARHNDPDLLDLFIIDAEARGYDPEADWHCLGCNRTFRADEVGICTDRNSKGWPVCPGMTCSHGGWEQIHPIAHGGLPGAGGPV